MSQKETQLAKDVSLNSLSMLCFSSGIGFMVNGGLEPLITGLVLIAVGVLFTYLKYLNR